MIYASQFTRKKTGNVEYMYFDDTKGCQRVKNLNPKHGKSLSPYQKMILNAIETGDEKTVIVLKPSKFHDKHREHQDKFCY